MSSTRSLSIRTLLLLLVLACVLPSVLVTVGVLTYDYQRERRQLIENTVLTARAISGQVDQMFSGQKASLHTLATSPTLYALDHKEFYDQAQLALQNQLGRNILLTDNHGIGLVNTLVPYGTPIVQSDSKAQTVRLGNTHAPAVSDLFRGATDNKLVVSVAVPVVRAGVHEYNVSLRIAPSVFSNLLARQGLSPDWLAAIADSSGTVVARTRDNDRFLGTKLPPNLLNALLKKSEGSVLSNTLEGIPAVGVFSQSEETGWIVAIGIPLELLTENLRRQLFVLMFLTCIVLLLGLSLAWLVSGRIIRANRGLIVLASALGEGRDLTISRFGVREADEVGAALAKTAEQLAASQHKANHDNLTGLPNRGLFYEIVAKQLRITARNGSPLSLLFIDLDGFKKINDQYGHAAGDHLLCAVASRLGSALRRSDTCARLGGDEFAVALPDTGKLDAELIGLKVIKCLSGPYEFDSHLMHVSASIGIAEALNRATNVEGLVRAADDAMYIAKVAGKARVHVSRIDAEAAANK